MAANEPGLVPARSSRYWERSAMPKTSHFALYIRTSTADQDGAAQLHALRCAAEARGWNQTVEFIDIGHSGAKASRPALDALKQVARKGEVRHVMVFALDRLGRSLRDLLLLLDELSAESHARQAHAPGGAPQKTSRPATA